MNFEEIVEVLDRGGSTDVQTQSSFDSLMISAKTLEKLRRHGFVKPSPVQEKAIPIGLLGRDMLVQAKSGTGKTLVFALLAVEHVNQNIRAAQKLIVAPTREIASQIRDTLIKLTPQKVRASIFVGGTSLQVDEIEIKKNPQILIGTTGRICQLVSKNMLKLDSIDFFVLDEADKLMEECFQKDINYIMTCLPPKRQVVVFSATYPGSLDETLSRFMRDVSLVRFNADDVQLVGIKQYVTTNCRNLLDSLVKLFRAAQFSQALVFCPTADECEPTHSRLSSEGFSAAFISGQMTQKQRDDAIHQLTKYKVKILVSSDLTARGIDADRVNLVVNLETAINPETYLHRIGRAARYGGQGAAITLLKDEKSLSCFYAMAKKGKIRVNLLSLDAIPHDITSNQQFWDQCEPLFAERRTTNAITDLEGVPQRIAAQAQLAKERGSSSTDYKYDRDAMLGLRFRENSISEKLSAHTALLELDADDVENKRKNFRSQLKDLENSLANSRQEKIATGLAGKPAEQISAPEKPKYKFIPTRLKAKTKFYMRGEIMAIREAYTVSQWHQYATKKFDLTEEPFLSTPPNGKTVMEPVEKRQILKVSRTPQNYDSLNKTEPVKVVKTEAIGNVQRYSRREMINIQISVPKNIWIRYVKTKWSTGEDPWELDPYMRCSFEEKLRRIRAKEKAERQKVMQERKKAVEAQPKLVSFGRTPAKIELPETSFADYQTRFRSQMQEFIASEARLKEHVGPVVPLRDPPVIWEYRVSQYNDMIRNMEKNFNYELAKEKGDTREVDVQCLVPEYDYETPEKPCQPSSDEQQDPASKEEQAVVKSSDAFNLDSLFGEVMDVSANLNSGLSTCVNNLRGIAQDRLEAVSATERKGGSDEQLKMEAYKDAFSSYKEDDEELDSEDYDIETGLSQIAERYRSNVDFNVVFSSYFQFMNSSIPK